MKTLYQSTHRQQTVAVIFIFPPLILVKEQQEAGGNLPNCMSVTSRNAIHLCRSISHTSTWQLVHAQIHRHCLFALKYKQISIVFLSYILLTCACAYNSHHCSYTLISIFVQPFCMHVWQTFLYAHHSSLPCAASPPPFSFSSARSHILQTMYNLYMNPMARHLFLNYEVPPNEFKEFRPLSSRSFVYLL